MKPSISVGPAVVDRDLATLRRMLT